MIFGLNGVKLTNCCFASHLFYYTYFWFQTWLKRLNFSTKYRKTLIRFLFESFYSSHYISNNISKYFIFLNCSKYVYFPFNYLKFTYLMNEDYGYPLSQSLTLHFNWFDLMSSKIYQNHHFLNNLSPSCYLILNHQEIIPSNHM